MVGKLSVLVLCENTKNKSGCSLQAVMLAQYVHSGRKEVLSLSFGQ